MDNNTNTAQQPPEWSSGYRYTISFLAFISQISLAMCLGCLSPLGPFIREALGMNFKQFGLLFTLSNLGTCIFLWITGPLVDKIGVKKVLVGGTTLMAVFLFIASTLSTATQLIAIQLCLGICNSVAGPTGSKMVGTWVAPHERSLHLSIKQAGIPAASTLAGFILPVLCAATDWRTTYKFVAAFVLVIAILGAILYKDSSVLIAEQAAGKAKPSFKDNAPLIFHKSFILMSIGCLLLMGAQFAVSSNLSNYAAGVLGAAGGGTDEAKAAAKIVAGRIYSYSTFAGIIGRLVWGWLADKFGEKKMLILNNIIAAILLVILAVAGQNASLGLLTMFMVLYGFTAFAWSGIQLGMAANMTPPRAIATAISVTLSFAFAGMLLFPPIFGAIVDASGFKAAWIFLAVFTIIGCAIVAPAKEGRDQK